MPAPPLPNLPELSVSELSAAIKRTMEDAFGFVRLRAEVSNYRGPHSSGHVYFCLKDSGARIDAVIWKGVFNRLRFRPEEGMEVIATGKVSTFPGSSKYQIVVETLEPAGIGALMALLEERRRKLTAEGLFDERRKQLLPFLPAVIGVVTSPTGAVIRDILHRLADRFPRRVLVWPVRVQGETSAAEVAAAIRGFDALPDDGSIPKPDVLIVARGGGSLEDLWSFNEEIVVRAAADCSIPLVSAVGHETDWTLIDLAADIRAPTPTAAAELVVPVRADLLARVEALALRQNGAIRRLLDRARADVRSAGRALPDADQLVGTKRQALDLLAGRLGAALGQGHRRHERRLDTLARRLDAQRPDRRLAQARERFARLTNKIDQALHRRLSDRGRAFAVTAARLAPHLVTKRVTPARERLTLFANRLAPLARRDLERRGQSLLALWKRLENLSHRKVLERGFALVRNEDGRIVSSATNVAPGDALAIEWKDGVRKTRVEGSTPAKPAVLTAPKSPQGSLF